MIKEVYKFSAPWCGPCKAYAKTFDEVSNTEDFKDMTFKTYDIEDDEGEGAMLAMKYGIKSIPTTVLIDENGNVVHKVLGNVPKNTLIDAIKNQNP